MKEAGVTDSGESNTKGPASAPAHMRQVFLLFGVALHDFAFEHERGRSGRGRRPLLAFSGLGLALHLPHLQLGRINVRSALFALEALRQSQALELAMEHALKLGDIATFERREEGDCLS